jgi:hypothetical protein
LDLDDNDLCSFRLTCKSVAYATSDPSFWRIRFREHFDMPPPEPARDIASLYKQRRDLLNPKKVHFARQYAKRNESVVAVLKELILGMDARCRLAVQR